MGTGPGVPGGGTAFDLGIYARAQSSQRSYGSIPTLSSTALDFSHSVLVQGVSGIVLDSNLVTSGYTVAAAVGSTGPAAGGAGAWHLGLMLAGLGWLGRVARRKARAATAATWAPEPANQARGDCPRPA